MAPSSTARAWHADLALTGVTFIWGSTFVVVKSALADASTLLFLAIRFSIATLALAVVFRPLASRFAAGGRRLFVGGILAGACLFAAYVLQTAGLRYTTASKSAFITGLAIVFVPVFAVVLDRKVPQPAEVLGVLAATLGMALLTLEPGSLRPSYGDLLTLACAVVYAVHILLVGYLAPRTGFAALSLVQIATAAVLSLGGFWWMETPKIRWTPGVIGALLVTGLLATALAFSVQTWAQQRTTPTRTALIFALEPVFAALTSITVAGEVLAMRAAGGAVLILAGILLVELKPLRRVKLASPPAGYTRQ